MILYLSSTKHSESVLNLDCQEKIARATNTVSQIIACMSFNKLQVFVEGTQLMVLVILMSIVTSAYSAKEFQNITQQALVST